MKAKIAAMIILASHTFLWSQPLRVACIGNSITSGSGDPKTSPNTYPAQLQTLLGGDYDVENFGVSGRTLLKKGDFPIWAEDAFGEALAFNPDIVTIMLGTNDSKPQNWAFKDEFVADYTAMIDTFLSCDAQPAIHLCLPPPAFSVQWGITDSIITTDMIPMIEQIAADKNLQLIDFYAPFEDKNELFPDDIHPNNEGCWEFAKVFYQHLTGNTVQSVIDVNLCLNQTVHAPACMASPQALADGDRNTLDWVPVDQAVSIDLGAVKSMNMFQIHFLNETVCQYSIDVSLDNESWQPVVEAAEHQADSRFAIAETEPVEGRYVRFQISQTEMENIPVIEFKALETAAVHAPVLTYSLDRLSTKNVRYNVLVTSAHADGSIKYAYTYRLEDPFLEVTGYQQESELELRTSIKVDNEKFYIAKAYRNGFETRSDTLHLNYALSAADQPPQFIPADFTLGAGYPNPFNPETVIPFALSNSVRVRAVLVDVNGRQVKLLADARFAAGQHQLLVQADDLGSGVYFVQMQAGGTVRTQKIVLVR